MIETSRLKIIPCDDTIFDALKMGNNILSVVLGANVPKKWTEVRDTFPYAAQRWKEHPPLHNWWLYLIIYKPMNMLIGSCGFKGEPNEAGEVEIGYEIRQEQRGMGLGAELAEALVDFAFLDSRVQKIIATTLPAENPSTAILGKLAFQRVEDSEATDESLWRWELSRR